MDSNLDQVNYNPIDQFLTVHRTIPNRYGKELLVNSFVLAFTMNRLVSGIVLYPDILHQQEFHLKNHLPMDMFATLDAGCHTPQQLDLSRTESQLHQSQAL